MDSTEDESPYKSKGVLTMKIEKLSEFAKQGEDEEILSEPVYIRGLPWKIIVVPQVKDDTKQEDGKQKDDTKQEDGKQKDDTKQKCLGYFVHCSTQNNLPIWGCVANVILKVLAQKEGKQDLTWKFKHTFNAKENYWGLAEFMTFEELMDPENGWYDESTDSIALRAEIDAEIPYGIDYFDSQIGKQMGNLLDNGEKFADCTLVASDGKEFRVYKGILACRSRVFAAMFEHKVMIESKDGVVKIEDIKSEVLEQMLRFIYSGMAPNLENMAKEMLIAAEKYELELLKMLCEQVLAHSLGTENACELLLLANRHSAKYLKGQAIKHIQQNLKNVMDSDDWNLLLEENDVNLMNEIMKAMATEK